MYSVEDLKLDLEILKKYDDYLEKIFECFKDCIENKYVYYKTIYSADTYAEIKDYLKDLTKNIKLQEVYSNLKNTEEEKEILESYKNEMNKNYILLEEVSNCMEDISNYIDVYYVPVIGSFDLLCSFFEVSDDEYDYIFKKLTNYCIVNEIMIPRDEDPDLIAEHLSNINDSKINIFLEMVYKAVEEINLKDSDVIEIETEIEDNRTKDYENGVFDFGQETIVKDEEEYEELEDILKNIKRNGGF